MSPLLDFHATFAPEVRMRSATVDSTPVKAYLISGDSSSSVTSLTIAASLSATIVCNDEVIMYTPQDSKLLHKL